MNRTNRTIPRGFLLQNSSLFLHNGPTVFIPKRPPPEARPTSSPAAWRPRPWHRGLEGEAQPEQSGDEAAQRRGKFGEAEVFLRGERMGRQDLGDPKILTNLKDQGKLGEAEELYRKALLGREAVLGSQHPETLFSLGKAII